MRLAYLGPPGTFGEEAALRFAPDAELIACPSHAAVAAAVDGGKAEAGVVAIENALSGSVAETLDVLIRETSLQIQAELVVPVVHNLIAAPGTKLSGVKVVYSHPAVLGQCRRFLEQQLPGAQFEASLSTAEAVRVAVARGGDVAAIGTVRAADLHGGEVLVRDIQDSDGNATRFVVLGHGRPSPTGHDRTSIAFTVQADRPGSLSVVLDCFARRGINCSKIESRPTKLVFGEYVFLVDFEGHQDDPGPAAALAEAKTLTAELKVFGSYPRWKTSAPPVQPGRAFG